MRCLLPAWFAGLFAALGLIGLLSPALAADYEPPVLRGSDMFVPAYPHYYRWDGAYAGGHLSYGNASVNFAGSTQPLFALPLRNLAFEQQFHASSVTVLGAVDTNSAGIGGFVGYNAQFDDAVVGLEFNYTHSDFNAIAPSNPIARLTGVLSNGKAYAFAFDAKGSTRITDFGLFQVRAGYAAGRFMPFATLGLAVGRADVALSVSCSCQELTPNPSPPPPFSSSVDFSFTQSQGKNSALLWGYTGGAGFEWALTPTIFARADYEYIQWQPLSEISAHLNIGHVGFGVRF
jgi:opacity protein-like surface antigen